MYLDINIFTWIWSIILSLARNLKICFTSIFIFFFANCARRTMLSKYTISTNSFSTLFVGNLQYKIWLIWFKVCKTRPLNICKYAPQCTWWPHFVNNFKYFFLNFWYVIGLSVFLQDGHIKIWIKQRVQTMRRSTLSRQC